MNTWRIALAILLVAASAAFVVGVSIERSGEENHAEATESSPGEESGEPRDEAGEEEGSEGGETLEEEGSEEAEEGESEELFGVSTESNAVVASFVFVSIALAIASLVVRSPLVFLLVGVFCIVAVAFDGREILNKLDESENTVAVLAGAVAALHVAAAAVALWLASPILLRKGPELG